MKSISLIMSLFILCCMAVGLPANAARHHQKAVSTVNQVVNLNTADVATLASLKGIGPKKAAAVVAYRQEHGSFKTVEDLTAVKGIGTRLLAKIKDKITV